MESENELVYLADDDNRVREARSALLRTNGTNVQAFNYGLAIKDGAVDFLTKPFDLVSPNTPCKCIAATS
jgi:FixJ family two-component response regulator